ncbi:MAG: ribulose-phosphate 3-epimerase [Parvularculales bacterium]
MVASVKISPSILAADFSQLGEEVRALDAAGADIIHMDIMDGHYVPNLTIGPGVMKAIRPCSQKPFDVHLMISPVDNFIVPFVEAGADSITFHPEASRHAHRTLQLIKATGCRAGVSLNPGTSVECVMPMLDMIDLVLVMSVNPGFGGQTFLGSQIGKIEKLSKIIKASGRDIDLQVDGGVTVQNAHLVIGAGATTLVAGTAVFQGGAESYESNIKALRSPMGLRAG